MSSGESQQARAQRAEERRRKMAEMDAAISSMGIAVTTNPRPMAGAGSAAATSRSTGPTPSMSEFILYDRHNHRIHEILIGIQSLMKINASIVPFVCLFVCSLHCTS